MPAVPPRTIKTVHFKEYVFIPGSAHVISMSVDDPRLPGLTFSLSSAFLAITCPGRFDLSVPIVNIRCIVHDTPPE